MRADVLRDRAVVHVAMAGVDIDRVLGIPEGDPVAHRACPPLPFAAGGRYGSAPPRPPQPNPAPPKTSRPPLFPPLLSRFFAPIFAFTPTRQKTPSLLPPV